METETAIDLPEAPRSPPPQQEPEPKRPKMSSTTATSDDDQADAANPRKPRYKRRKVAIFFAYCGVGYQGMQKNPGAKTIEGDLEEALFHAGAVPEPDRGYPRRYDWARSARTDKGVSAVGQVVSGRFYVDPPGFVGRLNSLLPDQIRIFGYKRATGSFNAKKFCDRRRYVYLIPVFALDPSCHRDRESVLASVGSGSELVKCLECSERGRKVFGVMGKRWFADSDESANAGNGNVDSLEAVAGDGVNHGSDILPGNEIKDASELNGDTNLNSEALEEVVGVTEDKQATESNSKVVDDGGPRVEGEDGRTENGVLEVDSNSGAVDKKNGNGEVEAEAVKSSPFSYGEKERERFNRILSYYVGTHNFHNFTTRTKAEDPAARRYIISFDASTTVTVEGIEFVKCEVVGQSFMLHQIRKMTGLAVAIMRNFASESLFEKSFQKDVRINVPTAPEVGLYLDECFFSSYNQKWKDSHEELSMKVYEEEAEEFKMKYIYSHIASTEHKEGSVALWLHSLNHRNYPDLRPVSNNDQDAAEKTAAEVVANVEAGTQDDSIPPCNSD